MTMGEDGGREWMRRGRKSCWEGEQQIVAQEKEGKGKELRIGIRK
jgi:hypothetical protein